MKKIVILLLIFVSLTAYSQSKQEGYYIYNIVSFEGSFNKEDFKVFYDDGKEVKRLKNENGDKIKFSTPAGALMYFLSQGWEMYLNGATSSGASYQGTGSSSTKSYWILRKPCTKEEFDKAVKDAVVK